MMRIGAIAALSLVCVGCADGTASALVHGPMRLAGPPAEVSQIGEETDDAGRKTLASKVMSAIALEKVTGRKPDPGRLMQLD